ncbi:hypothetical protein DJ71_01220, partial [Halorubrum sp. E3]
DGVPVDAPQLRAGAGDEVAGGRLRDADGHRGLDRRRVDGCRHTPSPRVERGAAGRRPGPNPGSDRSAASNAPPAIRRLGSAAGPPAAALARETAVRLDARDGQRRLERTGDGPSRGEPSPADARHAVGRTDREFGAEYPIHPRNATLADRPSVEVVERVMIGLRGAERAVIILLYRFRIKIMLVM